MENSVTQWNELLFPLCVAGLRLFFVLLLGIVGFGSGVRHTTSTTTTTKKTTYGKTAERKDTRANCSQYHVVTLFLDWHGWKHRVAGALTLLWLVYGSIVVAFQEQSEFDIQSKIHMAGCLVYDIVLGCLGLTVTLTAASDFPHKLVSTNAEGQSGTLSQAAMVTQAEMIEHAFYQFLNLCQAFYLHLVARMSLSGGNMHEDKGITSAFGWKQGIALWCVTAPWLVRSKFPVHSFSHNWIRTPKEKRTELETLLYRIKKGQYMFYKHVILHGVNLSLCLRPTSLVYTKEWRLFWLCLNTSYVMEFFLNSLVKRGVLSQATMMYFNRLLMAVSSFAAILPVACVVRWELCALSLLLNLLHRHHDVMNTMFLAAIGGLFMIPLHRIYNS